MKQLQKTEHPHIVKVPGVVGGEPVIAGTRISVFLVARYIRDGATAEELLELYPNLTPAAVHDAISYYYDHQAELDAAIDAYTLEALADAYGFDIQEDGRIVFRNR